MSEFSANILSSGFVGLESDKMAMDVTNKGKLADTKITSEAMLTDANKSILAPAEVGAAVDEVNEVMKSMQRNLSFTIDERLGEPIVSVIDIETDEVIRQIPSEELVVLRKKLDDVAGILFDTQV